ncbi:hypothetical protein ACFFF5_05075 [Lederbergia wuyishanensis]|uniref:Molybdopterin converting factor small subunit n=1 Tax=Lederbergia wuyishanensis TaxID=1347903 RepID=A0ABU0CZ45_9BACI|nr:hypothetical protein [Lederbergia wuyishanensis]MCJ8006044.1 hypothetical protein [Lederbergia wuyishanensis]MDQ0341413.1 molybdopterin converting factor small subunit [Lederbergia wuyishanensis]
MKKPLKEILAGMTTSEKVKYIWEYYKFFIIGGIILVVLIFSMVNSIVNKKEVVLNVVVMTGLYDPEYIDQLKNKLYEEFLTEEERDKSNIVIQTINSSSDQLDMKMGADMQKMAAELSAGYIDFFIVDKEFFDNMNDQNQLMSFQKTSGINDWPIPSDHLHFSKENSEDITGIDISTLNLFKGMVKDEDKIICVPANAKNTKYITRFLQYLHKNI